MMWFWGGAAHWWVGFLGFLITVLFWGLVVSLIVSLFRANGSKDHVHPLQEDPERTLARRFANGEINEEEFHRRLDVLRAHRASGGPGRPESG